jgi:hypothetical protein
MLKHAISFKQAAVALSVIIANAGAVHAQTYTTTDIVQDLPLYMGRRTPTVYDGVNDSWSQSVITVSVSGTLMSITDTESDVQENRANHTSCIIQQSTASYIFYIRDMSSIVDVANNGTDVLPVWQVILETTGGFTGNYIRQTNSYSDPTCGSTTKMPPTFWVPTRQIVLIAMNRESALRVQAMIASAWKSPQQRLPSH